MKTIRTILMGAAVVLAASCAKEPVQSVSAEKEKVYGGIEFTATVEDDTKTTLNREDKKIYWANGDLISINGIQYRAENAEGTYAKFVKNEDKADPEAPFTAYYPASIVGEGGVTTLPEIQYYGESKNLAGVFPMYAYKANNTYLEFKNICALFEIKVTGTEKIKRIVVSDGTKPLSGVFTVNEDNEAVISDQTSNVGVTLDCGEGIQLDEGTETAFYVAIPAGTYGTLSIMLVNDKNLACVKNVKKEVTISRNTIYPMPFTLTAADFNKTPLPVWYTELQYIQTNGATAADYEKAQYFDTGFVPKTNAKVQYLFTPVTINTEAFYFGCWGNESDKGRVFVHVLNTGSTPLNVGFGTGISSTNNNATVSGRNITTDYISDVILKNDGVTINGKEGTTTAKLNGNMDGNTISFYVGKCNDSKKTVRATNATKIYLVKIWEGETLVRHYVPVKSNKGEAGMYDFVNGVFNKSAVGEFTAGPVKQ